MGRLVSGVIGSVFFLQLFCSNVLADRIDDAIALSQATNRPLLAVGGADFCGPCRKLHKTIATDPQLQPLLENCVVLEMDSQTQEFQNFVNRFPADASMIPMVYVVLPDGHPIYAQSGGMDGTKLAGLLRNAIDSSTPQNNNTMLASASEEVSGGVDLEEMLQSARVHAQGGKLIDALEIVSPIAAMQGQSPQIAKARAYQTRLESVISQWMTDLAFQLERSESVHGAAYRLAELYVRTPDHPQLRNQARDLLQRFETETVTRVPVKQAKYLLKARYFEDNGDTRNALAQYEAVVTIDKSSPAGEFANRRLASLQDRVAAEMTVQSR